MRTTKGKQWRQRSTNAHQSRSASMMGARATAIAVLTTVIALAASGIAMASPSSASAPAPGLAVVANQANPLSGLEKGLAGLVNGVVKGVQSTVGSLLHQPQGSHASSVPPPAVPHVLPSAGTYRAVATANPYRPFSTGYDISWPNCGSSYPSPPYNMAIVGVNDGRAFTGNPCLSSEAHWAAQGAPNAYMNINAPPPGPPNSTDQTGPAGTCSAANQACLAYNYGYNTAIYSVAYANASGVQGHRWWLDVELVSSDPSYWTANQGVNANAIAGAITGLRARGENVGIYSTSYQFGLLAGAYAPRLPNWVAGAPSSHPGSLCGPAFAFGGGAVWFTQYSAGRFDGDYAC